MITKIRHDCPESKGFTLIRKKGHKNYTFLHFITPVTLRVKGIEYAVKNGGCILYAPETPQYFKSECALLHNWFHADDSLTELIDEYSIPVDTVFYPQETEFISVLLKKAELEFLCQNDFREKMIYLTISQLFCELSRNMTASVQTRVLSGNQEKMRLLRLKILAHPERQMSVEEMASFTGLSPSRFHSLYKAVFGISPLKDSIIARIDLAKAILLSEDISISALAERLGYNDQYHFIRQFKKETGLSPYKYKKNKC